MADRFYCPDPPVAGRWTLAGEEARHLARVRRLGAGDLVEVFDGRGMAYRAEVCMVGKDHVELAAVGSPITEPVPGVHLTLATAVPKGERFDWLVEKAVEVGVARLVPLQTERSVVDPRAAKLERLRRLVIEASKQCGRSRLMEIGSPMPLADYLGLEAAPIRLLAHPGGSLAPSWPRGEPGGRAALAIGPEGGFTDAEVAAARAAGWQLVGLGPTILRIETAGLVGAALILAFLSSEVRVH
ncbi:MAG: 16S rRNA (uracil(1498)-N(3))-methyltransferase [Isosphaeraceae bacterium]|nr:16S rRNA (uracil(1498)-N(3))-methyltransferase [Isosphaeraceae bacterium]